MGGRTLTFSGGLEIEQYREMGERTQFSRLLFAGLVLFSLNNLKRNFKILDKDSSLISFQVVSEASQAGVLRVLLRT